MGCRLREFRERMGITQEELAEKSGVSRAIISMLENDCEKNTQTNTLLRLAKALGATIDQIFFN